MIQIQNLSKSFGDNLVWENVSFEIGDGETIAIIGRSGCGKSVFVKHLNALMYPDEGKVVIDGKNIFELEFTNFGCRFGNCNNFSESDYKKGMSVEMNLFGIGFIF